MPKTLIIAEKPSVAQDLAGALGKVPKKGDHFENDEYVISSAVGHVVELEMPEDIDKKKIRLLATRDAADHPRKVRTQADRGFERSIQSAQEASSPQRYLDRDQRLRRRARRRADFSKSLSALEIKVAGKARVDANR